MDDRGYMRWDFDPDVTEKQLEEYRQKLRKMNDAELIRDGKNAALLCSPQQTFGKAAKKSLGYAPAGGPVKCRLSA